MKRKSLVAVLILMLAIVSFAVLRLNDRIDIDLLSIAQKEHTLLQKKKSRQDGDDGEQSVAQLEGLFEPIMPNGAKG